MIKILVLSGSSRRGSLNMLLARTSAVLIPVISDRAKSEFLDLSSLDLPALTESPGHATAALDQAFAAADALLVSSDEYNGSYSTLLRRAMSWINRLETLDHSLINGKPVLLVGSKPRGINDVRGFPAIAHLLRSMGATVETMQIDIGPESNVQSAGRVLADGTEVILRSTISAWLTNIGVLSKSA